MNPIRISGGFYPVTRRSGYIKADLRGRMGWTALWMSTDVEDPRAALGNRIRSVLSGNEWEGYENQSVRAGDNRT